MKKAVICIEDLHIWVEELINNAKVILIEKT